MSRRDHTADAALADLAPNDEVGTPDDELVRCACGTIHRKGDEVHPQVCDEVGAVEGDA